MSIEEAKKQAPYVLNAFNEDIKLIKTLEPSNISGMSQSQEIAKLSLPISAASKDLLPVGYGDYQVLLPKDKSEAKEVWDI